MKIVNEYRRLLNEYERHTVRQISGKTTSEQVQEARGLLNEYVLQMNTFGPLIQALQQITGTAKNTLTDIIDELDSKQENSGDRGDKTDWR